VATASVADMFNFDSIADEDAQARRDLISANTNANMAAQSTQAGSVAGMLQVSNDIPGRTGVAGAMAMTNALRVRPLGAFS
jgi:hypothetical protein